jgi:heterodisulfide reductase subunit B
MAHFEAARSSAAAATVADAPAAGERKARYQRVAYYPGCALEGTAHAYDLSTRAVGRALGLELDEVRNWNCCGAMEVKNIDPGIQTYLSSRVMSIAANEMRAQVVMAPCNGCYHNLKKAEHDLAHDEASRTVVDRLSKKAGHAAYAAGQIETIHALDWIKHGVGEDSLKERVRNSLRGLKVANYYGCMYTRPRHIFPEKDRGTGSESTLEPHFMDDLLAAAGAENVDFPLKTACCGGAHTLSDSDISTRLVLNILRAAESAGADVIATECPTCHSGLEMHQVRAETVFGERTTIRMMYFTQLLGIALGLPPRKVALHENVSDGIALLEAKEIG